MKYQLCLHRLNHSESLLKKVQSRAYKSLHFFLSLSNLVNIRGEDGWLCKLQSGFYEDKLNYHHFCLFSATEELIHITILELKMKNEN